MTFVSVYTSTTGMWSQTVLWIFFCVCVYFSSSSNSTFSPLYFKWCQMCLASIASFVGFFCFFLTKRRKISAYISWHLHLCSFISPPFFHFLSLLNVHCERSELKFTALHGMYVYLVEFSRVRGWLYDFGTEATTQFSTGGGGLKGGWLVWVMHIHSVLKYGVCRIP